MIDDWWWTPLRRFVIFFWLVFLVPLVVIIILSPVVVVEMMYSWTEEAFSHFWTRRSLILGSPKAHEAGIVLPAIFFFVFLLCIFDGTEYFIMCVLLVEYVVLRPRRTLCWGAYSETSVLVWLAISSFPSGCVARGYPRPVITVPFFVAGRPEHLTMQYGFVFFVSVCSMRASCGDDLSWWGWDL